MSQVSVFHNPRCRNSRGTLSLLRDEGIEPEIFLYLTTPLSKTMLSNIIKTLGFSSARELMRKKEILYTHLQLDDVTLSEDALLQALIEHPILIERPIVIVGQHAAICRPPEKVFDILELL